MPPPEDYACVRRRAQGARTSYQQTSVRFISDEEAAQAKALPAGLKELQEDLVVGEFCC
jgi:hypothetical protein